ncbi:zinc-binding dehydrogenase [Mucilaginibacter lappiensis]|uniref:zinc-binding dehydrogenase n=1 Tax=Mucilaginibacter lappiensis TaxID=354630 RepID=UPI003D24C11E
MKTTMKALVLLNGNLEVQEVPKPQKAEPGHVIVKIEASTINSGDKFFLKYPTPAGTVKSLYDIRGVSGAGAVLNAGDDVPGEFQGKNVAFYRQLKYSENIVGAWSEFAQVHYLDCVILPENAVTEAYSGSVVNVITPYAFLKQVTAEGHKGIISTAGNSATGIALLGFCLAYDFPLISVVRNENGKNELLALGAKNIVVQSDADFDQQLTALAAELSTTAIFDGVGGQILNKLLPLIPRGSVIYSYGFICDSVPFSFHTSLLAVKNVSIRPFANTSTETVKNSNKLAEALKEIGQLIHQPHFKTKIGERFKLEEINEAISYVSENGGKAVLKP